MTAVASCGLLLLLALAPTGAHARGLAAGVLSSMLFVWSLNQWNLLGWKV
jgi:hypothetical protein